MNITVAINKSNITVDKEKYPMFSTKKEHIVNFEDWDSMSILESLNTKIPDDTAMSSSYSVGCRENIYSYIESVTKISNMIYKLKRCVDHKATLLYPVAIKVELENRETPSHVKKLSKADIDHLTMGMNLLIGKEYTNYPKVKVARFRSNTISVLCVPEDMVCCLISTYLHILRDGSKEMIDYMISVGTGYSVSERFNTASASEVDGLIAILLKKNNPLHNGYSNTYYIAHLDVLFAMCINFGNGSSYSHYGNGPISGGTSSISIRNAVDFCERFQKQIEARLGSYELNFSDEYSYGMDIILKVQSAIQLVKMKQEAKI